MPEPDDDKKLKEDEPDTSRLLSIASFVAVSIIVGIPLWWQTTDTYRVSLPYGKIQDLSVEQLTMAITAEVVGLSGTWNHEAMEKLQSDLETNLKENKFQLLVEEKYRIITRHPTEFEAKHFVRNENLDDISDTFISANNAKKIGQLTIFILPAKTNLIRGGKNVYVGRNRFIFIKSTSNLQNDVEQIKEVLLNLLINREALQTTIANVVAPHLIMPDKGTVRSLRNSAALDITFNLIVPQPNLVKATWDIEHITDEFFQPMFQKLSEVVKINVKSQVLYLTSLNIQPNYNKEKNHYYVTAEQLPHVLNPIEVNLGSHISTEPNINFVVYIPPKEQSPLFIYDSTGNPSSTNAFLSPRWGGIFIYNDDSKSETIPHEFLVNSETVARVFLAQTRLLLGLNPLENTDSITFASFDKSVLMDWELDHLLRKNTLENIATSSNTLRSLAQLLDQISNIVINDEVGNSVVVAVDATMQSLEYLKNDNLLAAFLSSKEGYIASEKAFFDPSMLALLYFPDDQKYAVYVPLFLPVGVPIVLSIFYLIQAVKKSRSKTKID